MYERRTLRVPSTGGSKPLRASLDEEESCLVKEAALDRMIGRQSLDLGYSVTWKDSSWLALQRQRLHNSVLEGHSAIPLSHFQDHLRSSVWKIRVIDAKILLDCDVSILLMECSKEFRVHFSFKIFTAETTYSLDRVLKRT